MSWTELTFSKANYLTEGLFSSSAKTPQSYPLFALSNELGTELFHSLPDGPITMTMISSVEQYISNTINIIVDTPTGDDTNVILTGSHLDSVPAGPGINDNGSGSSTNLEMALQFARNNVKPINTVRFAWWAAEELGLKGSTFYVQNLAKTDPTMLQNIAFNVNYDMLGSTNFIRGIYNGSEAQGSIRASSITLMKSYQAFFDKYNLPWELVPFDGRSDYGPFLEVIRVHSQTRWM